MSNASLAAQALANIQTVAPPSFDGQGWLVALNLFGFTAGTCLMLMLAGKLGADIWRCRLFDRLREPAQVLRLIFFLLAMAGVLRFGGEALTLWGWNPHDPAATAAALKPKRLLDPIALALAFAAFGTFVLAERQLIELLRRRPPPVNLWPRPAQLRRPALVVALCLVAAVGVVSTR